MANRTKSAPKSKSTNAAVATLRRELTRSRKALEALPADSKTLAAPLLSKIKADLAALDQGPAAETQKPKRKAKSKSDKSGKFPLTAHPSGRWCKTARVPGTGRRTMFYFGPIDDPDAALAKYNREWRFLKEGKTPPTFDLSGDSCTMRKLCNAFLSRKMNKMNAGELTARTFGDYKLVTDLLIGQFGPDRRVDDLRTDDFDELRSSLAKRLGPTSLRNEIVKIRTVFNFAYDERMIDKPVWYGQSFNFPSKKVVRRAENANDDDENPNLFTPAEVKRILKAADVPMRAMVLLACNGGLGNTDVALLPISAVNFDKKLLRYPRPKTEIMRKIPLWPETIAALREVLNSRREPKDAKDAGLLFITIQGRRWLETKPGKKNTNRYVTTNMVAHNFSRLLRDLHINGRKRLGFYTLRHVFETIGGDAKDQVALDFLMGHSDPSMAAEYREGIPLERLQAVTGTLHRWLYGK